MDAHSGVADPSSTGPRPPEPTPRSASWVERLAGGRIRTPDLPAVLQAPAGLWLADGEAWLADAGGHAVWSLGDDLLRRRIGWGARGWSGDGGAGPDGQLWTPFAGCVWGDRQVIADYGNGRLRTLDRAGVLGTLPWPAGLPMLQGPAGLAVDASGGLLVADFLGHRLFRLDAAGGGEVLAGTGQSGPAESGIVARGTPLDRPLSLLMRADGHLVVGEGGSGRILSLTPGGRWTVLAEAVPEPSALLGDGAGGMLVASGETHRILHLSAGGVRQMLAGTGESGTSGDDGPPAKARFIRPAGLIAWQGGLLVADLGTPRLRWIVPAP